jgi:hypothetical protein
MLQNIKDLYGMKLGAMDGEIGHIKDFYFDDVTWSIRYLVVDTGSWLTGRQVLLSPDAFERYALSSAEAGSKLLKVNLTKKQIENSPSVETHLPISRHYENEYYRYYGWPNYWADSGMWGAIGIPATIPPPIETADRPIHQQIEDIHLRSTDGITNYEIHATDGDIGRVSSFMVDGSSWVIRALIADAGHWFSKKVIYLATKYIIRISYEDSTVFVNLNQQEIGRMSENPVMETGDSGLYV